MKNCPNCGAQIDDETKFCSSCGKPVETAVSETVVQSADNGSGDVSSRTRLKAALLAYFLGWIGIHNFYLGRKVRAFIQIGLTVLLGWVYGIGIYAAAIWGLVEMIVILTGNCKDGEGKSVTNWVNPD